VYVPGAAGAVQSKTNLEPTHVLGLHSIPVSIIFAFKLLTNDIGVIFALKTWLGAALAGTSGELMLTGQSLSPWGELPPGPLLSVS